MSSLKWFFLALLSSFNLLGCSIISKKNPDLIIREVVQSFFNNLKTETIHDVYLSTHPSFRTKTSLEEFAWLVEVYEIKEHQHLQIEEILKKSDLWHVVGSLELNEGKDLPVHLKVVPGESDQEWKIIHLSLDLKEYVTRQGMQVPDLATKNQIARKTLQNFQFSLRDFRMNRFYDSVSEIWKKKISLENFNRIYMPMMRDPFVSDDFATGRILLDAISGVSESGLLRLKGKVNSNLTYSFDSEFFFTNGHWNLVRFEIGVNGSKP